MSRREYCDLPASSSMSKVTYIDVEDPSASVDPSEGEDGSGEKQKNGDHVYCPGLHAILALRFLATMDKACGDCKLDRVGKLKNSDTRHRLGLKAILALCFLVVQNSAAVLIMRYTLVRPGERHYLTSTAVIMAEVLKTTVSAAVVMQQHGTIAGIFSDKLELLKTCVPALLYVLQNNLQYVAVQNLHAATFQVTYQIKILTTALLWVATFRKPLSRTRWCALCILLAGVVCVRHSDSKADSKPGHESSINLSLGLTATLLATLTSALAGVYFEMLLKGTSKLTVWQRNAQMGAYSVLIGLVGMLCTGSWRQAATNGFFHGYTKVTAVSILIQGGGGLLIGVVVKYANVIMKDIATTVSITVSCYLSWYFFGQVIGDLFIEGVLLVIVGVCVYSMSE